MVEPCLGRADLFETRHWPELALFDQESNDNKLAGSPGLLGFLLYQRQQEHYSVVAESTGMELESRNTRMIISIVSDAQPGAFCLC